MRPSALIVCLLFAGCVAPDHDTDAGRKGYERGYRQAVKEQYWILQNQQRVPAPNPTHP